MSAFIKPGSRATPIRSPSSFNKNARKIASVNDDVALVDGQDERRSHERVAMPGNRNEGWRTRNERLYSSPTRCFRFGARPPTSWPEHFVLDVKEKPFQRPGHRASDLSLVSPPVEKPPLLTLHHPALVDESRTAARRGRGMQHAEEDPKVRWKLNAVVLLRESYAALGESTRPARTAPPTTTPNAGALEITQSGFRDAFPRAFGRFA